MLSNAILYLVKSSNNRSRIYIHNLSNFDGIFILNSLAEIKCEARESDKKIDITPILRNGNFITIKIKFNKYNISIRDSYLLLPLSLSKLSKQFQVEHEKTTFPHNFLNDKINNENIDLNYVGLIPDMKFFDNIDSFILFIDNYLKSSLNNGER